RAPGRPALDDRENGDRPDRRHVSLFCLPSAPGPGSATAAERSRRPDRRVARAWDHRLDHDFVSSRLLCRDRDLVPAPPLFSRAIRSARADRCREAFPFPSDRGQLWTLPDGRGYLLPLAPAEDDFLFLPRHRIARLDADVDRAAILFFRDPLCPWFRAGL